MTVINKKLLSKITNFTAQKLQLYTEKVTKQNLLYNGTNFINKLNTFSNLN